MKLADIAEACCKLRLRKQPLRFRPRLIYLVDTCGGYKRPGQEGFVSGQTAWADPSLWYQCHGDAAVHAKMLSPGYKAKVVKLNICAFEEQVKST